MLRAAHQLLDAPVVFRDPLAIALLGDHETTAIRERTSASTADQIFRYLRTLVAARSRVAEGALADAIAAGIQKFVMLGAVLETFAYRNPYAALHVLEVD